MAFSVDASTQSTYGTANPNAVNHTCAVGADLLVLRIFVNGTTARTGGAPTYNGVALTDSGQGFVFDTGGECGVEVWYLLAPSSGTNSLSIPNSGLLNIQASITSYIAGTGNVAAFDNSNKASGTTQNPSLVLVTGVNNCLIDAGLGSGERDNCTAGANYTLAHTFDAGNQTWGSEYDLDAGNAGNVTVNFGTARADDWGLIGISFKEVTEPTTTTTTTAEPSTVTVSVVSASTIIIVPLVSAVVTLTSSIIVASSSSILPNLLTGVASISVTVSSASAIINPPSRLATVTIEVPIA